MIRQSLAIRRIRDPTFMLKLAAIQTREYQRRHYPDGPERRCSIHNRPTCPCSADDGAMTEPRKGPIPVSYKINLRFRRFGCGTGQITGLDVYQIARDPTKLRLAVPCTKYPSWRICMAKGSSSRR